MPAALKGRARDRERWPIAPLRAPSGLSVHDFPIPRAALGSAVLALGYLSAGPLGLRTGGNRQTRNAVIDARGTGLSETNALRGLGRAGGISRGSIDNITIIGNDFLINRAVGH
jgi:hypothetical protein